MNSIRVQCYAGYRGEETPRRFWLGPHEIEVLQVLDRWLSPAHRYFKLRCDDNGIYILRHDNASWQWDITCYQSAKIQPLSDFTPWHKPDDC